MSIFILLFSFSLAFANSFNMDVDGLCFANGSEELKRFGPLGKLGHKKGVCQGMSGLVAAFHEHASFKPTKDKMTDNEAFWAVQELRRYHSGGCASKKKIEIAGFSNLKEFCQSHRDLLLSNAIDYNADIAVREISWNLDEFLIVQDSPLTTTLGRKKIQSSIDNFRKHLVSGRWPLMLYYTHVVAVHSVHNEFINGKLSKVVFGIYDSNYSKSIQYTIQYSDDGLPKAGQRMIWDVTPSRLTTVCW